MKRKKFWENVLSFLGVVITVTAINMGIKVAMEGMWLLGIPKPEAVSSVTIKHQYETEQIKEITDPEQIETCVHLTGFLKYRPFADPEVATGKASPLITFYYHLNNGDTVEVSANANTVFYNGKKHVLKDDDSFVNFVEGLFFNDSVLYGRISEIADGNLLIEADGKSYIIHIGLFVGYALYELLRYKTHPEFYALTSAPWYTGILLYGAVAGFIAVVLGVAILILKKKVAH